MLTRNDNDLELLFQEKVKFIEENTRIGNLHTYFTMQVGPKDATTIINQLKGFFMSGYREGQKDFYK